MRTLRSLAWTASLALGSLALVHCGPSPEPNVPGPTPPPPETAAPAASVSAAPTETAAPPAASTATAVVEAPPPALPHWTYEGEEGPVKWGELSPAYIQCKIGTSQSPIDIVTKKAEVDKSLQLIDFNYGAPVPLQIWNNGHTVQVQNGGPATIKAAGGEWKLLQLHFHAPSEHSIDGKLADLEAHFVHSNDKGQLAVVGLLFKKGKKDNKAFAPIFDHVPTDATKEALPVPGTTLDLAKLLPAKPSYYTYSGSLTTPKCTEDVRWFVLKPTEEVSEAQLERFHGAVHHANNRPVQPLGSRKVTRPN